MSQQIQIFGQELTLETMRVAAVAINEGFSVTVQAVLDNEDVLVAKTVARSIANFDDVTTAMIPEAATWVREWIEAHESV